MAVLTTATIVSEALVGVTLSATWIPAEIDKCIVEAHNYVQSKFSIDLTAWDETTSGRLTNIETKMAVAVLLAREAGDPYFTKEDTPYTLTRKSVEGELQRLNTGLDQYDRNGTMVRISPVSAPTATDYDTVIYDIKDDKSY